MKADSRTYKISLIGSMVFVLMFGLAFLIVGFQVTRQVTLRKERIHHEIEEFQTSQLLKLENFYQNSYLPMQEQVILESLQLFEYGENDSDLEIYKSFQEHIGKTIPWDDSLIKINLFRPKAMYQDSLKFADLLESGLYRRMITGRGPQYEKDITALIELTRQFGKGQYTYLEFKEKYLQLYELLKKKFDRLNIKPEIQSIKVTDSPPIVKRGESVFNQFTLGKIQQHVMDYIVFGGDSYMGEVTLNDSLVSVLSLFNIMVLNPKEFSTMAELQLTWQVLLHTKNLEPYFQNQVEFPGIVAFAFMERSNLPSAFLSNIQLPNASIVRLKEPKLKTKSFTDLQSTINNFERMLAGEKSKHENSGRLKILGQWQRNTSWTLYDSDSLPQEIREAFQKRQSMRYSTQDKDYLKEYLKSPHFPGYTFNIKLPKKIAYSELSSINQRAVFFLITFALLLLASLLLFLQVLPRPLIKLSRQARQIVVLLRSQDFSSLQNFVIRPMKMGSSEILELFWQLDHWLQSTKEKFRQIYTVNSIANTVAQSTDYKEGLNNLLGEVARAIQTPLLEVKLSGTLDARPFDLKTSYATQPQEQIPIPPLSLKTHEAQISAPETQLNLKIGFAGNQESKSDQAFVCSLLDQLGSLLLQLIMRDKQSQNLATGDLIKDFMSVVPHETRGIEISVLVKTAKYLGGDFLHIQSVADSKTAFAISDVSGKGPGPAVFGQTCKSMLQILLGSSVSEEKVLDKLNQYLTTDKRDMLFATMFLAIYDPDQKEIRWSAAGHNRMLYQSTTQQELIELNQPGMALAMMPGAQYPQNRLSVREGDRLVLYTDGLMDLKNPEGENFEIDRFKSFLLKNQNLNSSDLIKGLEELVESYRENQPYPDDLSVIVATVL